MKIFPLSRRMVLAVVLAVTAIAYIQSFTHGFVLDDHDMLERVIPSIHRPIEAWETGNAFQSYYRPVFLTSLYIDNLLFGNSPAGYHAVNLVLHLLAVWCAFLFAERIFHNPTAAAAAALLFAIQPAHTENVSWISGRTDILCAIFVFLSLSAFYDLVRCRTGKLAWISAGYFFLALASKEVAVVMPALCLFMLMVWNILPADPSFVEPEESPKRKAKKKIRRRSVKPVVLALFLFTLGALGLLILRNTVMQNTFTENTFTTDSAVRLNAVRCFALYLYHGIMGGGYDYLIRGWRVVDPKFNLALPGETSTWVWMGAAAGLFLIAFVAAIRWRRGAAALGLAGFALFIFPALGFVPIQSIFSVRFLYLPSFFFSLAAVDAVRALREKAVLPKLDIAFAVVFSAIVIWWGYSTFTQDAYWKDDVTLFTEMKDAAIDSPVLYFSLGNGYRYQQDYMSAARNFSEAVQLFPRYHDAYLNLAACYMILGDKHPEYYSTALDVYDKATATFPRDPQFYMLMGDACLRTGDTQRAIQDYATSYSLDKSPEVRKRLDMLHVQLPNEE